VRARLRCEQAYLIMKAIKKAAVKLTERFLTVMLESRIWPDKFIIWQNTAESGWWYAARLLAEHTARGDYSASTQQ
jgi:hypothetical protein